MAQPSLAKIREKLKAQADRNSGTSTNKNFGDRAIYPHWDIPDGTTARIRLLPDGNKKNDFFWVERLMINLTFAGIKGQSDSKPVTVQVPCMEMYKETCPILAEVRGWFKDQSLEDMGRKYWKKKSYLFQGFVRENPMKDDQSPDNPIRRLTISPQIFNIIHSSLLDPDLENIPTDYENGLDFSILKTSKGAFADYSTSKWSRKETALTAEEERAIDQYGLNDLSSYLPKKPTDVEIAVIKDMFEASVDGQAYDSDKWGNYFRPRGISAATTQSVSVTPVSTLSKSVDSFVETEHVDTVAEVLEHLDAVAPVAAQAAASGNQKAEDILAMIRSRQKTS